MKRKLLNEQELEQLYQEHLLRDFPRSELKPLHAMKRLMELGRYEPLALLDEKGLAGYAMIWLTEERDGALLEYLGVPPERRNEGLGARILEVLADQYGQLFGEAEAPDADDPAENLLRRRRLGFYQRCGFRILDYQCGLFGVRFHGLYRGPLQDDAQVLAMHRKVYADYFPADYMGRLIQIPVLPGEALPPAAGWVEDFDLPGGGEQDVRP